MLSKVCLPEQTVTWIPRKIFRISYQNLNSRFFSTILLWFLSSIQVSQVSSYSKIYLLLGFRSVPCLCEIRRNMQRKGDNEEVDLWIWSLANFRSAAERHTSMRPKNQMTVSICLHRQQLQPPPTTPQMKIFSTYLLTGTQPWRNLLGIKSSNVWCR